MKLRDFLNEGAKAIHLTYTDALNNEYEIDVKNSGAFVSVSSNGRGRSLSSIAFNITPKDFREAGYANSGEADKKRWVLSHARKAYKETNGDPSKFAKLFGKYMKLPFVADENLWR